jgi:hypothetical protein
MSKEDGVGQVTREVAICHLHDDIDDTGPVGLVVREVIIEEQGRANRDMLKWVLIVRIDLELETLVVERVKWYYFSCALVISY